MLSFEKQRARWEHMTVVGAAHTWPRFFARLTEHVGGSKGLAFRYLRKHVQGEVLYGDVLRRAFAGRHYRGPK